MLRKILIFILCLSMIIPTKILDVKAEEYVTKFLPIKRVNDEITEMYEVVTDGENVYISVDDLIKVVGFDEKVIDVTDDIINQIILTKEVDHHGYDQDINIFPKKNQIKSAWYGEKEFDGCLNLEKGVYLDLIQIFNYLRIKAEVVGTELLVNIPVYSILDFMIYDYQSVLHNSVSQLDLLKAQEGKVSSGFFDALSLACNNFDFRLLIPVWGANELKDEQYTKAIQTLNMNDEIFFDNDTSEYMKAELSNRGFDGVLASGKDLVNVMSIGGKGVETAEEVISTLENIPSEKIEAYMNMINWNGESYDGFIEMRVWNKYASNISDAISVADLAVSAYETYVRAENWNQECMKDLEVLRNLDVNNYGEHKEYVKRIKKIAESCYQESVNKRDAVSNQILEDMSTLLLEKTVAESSIYGKVLDYFILAVNTGISVAKCFGNIADEMDKAELSYMVTCLINVAVASRIDAEIEYDMLNLEDIHSGEVEEFRNSIRIAIKSNLRCWSYIYYLNSDGTWEKTYKGKETKSRIDKMNTYLTLLEESEQYDYTLDEYDLITYSPKKIVEILKNSNVSEENDDIEISLYLEQYELLAEILNMEPMDYWQFADSKSYVVDQFYLEWKDELFSMKNEGAFYVKLYGISIGDSMMEVERILQENGWVNYIRNDNMCTYITILNNKEYLLSLYLDNNSNLSSWYLNNWPEGEGVGEAFSKLKGDETNNSIFLNSNIYEYVNGEFLSYFSIDEIDGKKNAALLFWHNFGESASDEEFFFEWIDGKLDYEVVGNRSKKKCLLKFNQTNEGVIIRVTCIDGIYYSWETGEKDEEWVNGEYKRQQ